ncbi:uncharacterized protein LOC114308709 isoform X2 [Camellia sinensis]|uniref:uncharacterized protein LOC114308709 isoform X2 n=1 Tax=Camellia sinensis TaxID=4442 RepID=UPI001035A8A2|nr:uncharacterized protein LOC114308709 isoform X2 [Camellia sinensis]
MNNVPMEQTFSFETNLSGENSTIGKDAKEESRLLGPSCFPKTCADDNHLSRVHTGGIWDGPMMDVVVNSEHDKLTIGFGSMNTQLGGNVMPGNIWRLDEEIVLQGTSAEISAQQQQSAGCFPTFGMLSDKEENELLGVDGKYDSMSSFQGAQSGHIEHVEFNFLTMQNLNSLPGDSKSVSYNTRMVSIFLWSFVCSMKIYVEVLLKFMIIYLLNLSFDRFVALFWFRISMQCFSTFSQYMEISTKFYPYYCYFLPLLQVYF